jgi:hypothetical protein
VLNALTFAAIVVVAFRLRAARRSPGFQAAAHNGVLGTATNVMWRAPGLNRLRSPRCS